MPYVLFLVPVAHAVAAVPLAVACAFHQSMRLPCALAERCTAFCAAAGARRSRGSRCCGANLEALPGPGRGERLLNVFVTIAMWMKELYEGAAPAHI